MLSSRRSALDFSAGEICPKIVPKTPISCSKIPADYACIGRRKTQVRGTQYITQIGRECVLLSLDAPRPIFRHSQSLREKQDVSKRGTFSDKVSNAMLSPLFSRICKSDSTRPLFRPTSPPLPGSSSGPRRTQRKPSAPSP